MSEEEFNAIVNAWIAREDARVFAAPEAEAFRALCREQAAAHSSASWRMLFGRAAALPVITGKIAAGLAPFVENHESRIS